MTAEQKVLVYETYHNAIAEIRAAKLPESAAKIFTEAFEQRHHLKARVDHDRKGFAEVAGLKSVRQVSRLLGQLRGAGFIFWGKDSSGRHLGVIYLSARYLVRSDIHEVIHKDFHILSTRGVTGTSMSRSPLPQTPTHSAVVVAVRPATTTDVLYSAKKPALEGFRPRAVTLGRQNNGYNGAWSKKRIWTAAGLTASFLRDHSPPAPS